MISRIIKSIGLIVGLGLFIIGICKVLLPGLLFIVPGVLILGIVAEEFK